MGICNSILNDMSRSLGLLGTGSNFRRGSCSSQGKIRNFSCMFHGTRPRYCLQRSGSSLIQDDWVLPLPKDLSFLWVHGSSSVTQWLALLPHHISVYIAPFTFVWVFPWSSGSHQLLTQNPKFTN